MSTVLVVDDEPLVALTAAMVLSDAGFETLEAHDGDRALSILSETPVDLVVTDYMMPRRNGLELARAMRQDPDHAEIPVVLVSAVPGDVVSRNPGLFAAFLQKPYGADELIDVVRHLTDGRE
jgi:CheY-like chemotaxis protein